MRQYRSSASATIEFEDDGLSAHCNCPVCYDCKHAAACLLELAQSNSTQAMTPPDTLEEPQQSEVDGWTQRLTTHQKKLQRQLEGSFRSSYDCVIFSLEPSFGHGASAVRIALRIYSVRISDGGGFSKGRLYKIDNYGHYHGTGSTREDNLLIDTVRAMTRHSIGESRYQIAEPYLIEGHLGAAVMQLLMNTQLDEYFSTTIGKCRWLPVRRRFCKWPGSRSRPLPACI